MIEIDEKDVLVTFTIAPERHLRPLILFFRGADANRSIVDVNVAKVDLGLLLLYIQDHLVVLAIV